MKVTELEKLGEALGLQLQDALPHYRDRFERFKNTPEAARIVGGVLPIMEGLLDVAAAQASQDRSSVYGWLLAGQFNGVRVEVRASSSTLPDGGAGHGAVTTGTLMQAMFEPPLQLGLKITHESMVSNIVQTITGRHDLQVGHPELDRVIHVEANDANAARQLLADPQIQGRLLSAYADHPYPVITDLDARLNHFAAISRHDVIKTSLTTLTDIVRAMSTPART